MYIKGERSNGWMNKLDSVCDHEFVCVCDWGYDAQCIKCLNYFSMEKVNEYIKMLRKQIANRKRDKKICGNCAYFSDNSMSDDEGLCLLHELWRYQSCTCPFWTGRRGA